ncbi:hypothetical protein BGZ58_001769 [Dissophora ornata]|nr:hypothetical protein BGZ58_001769 [Dissophora ornata]
MIRGGYAERLVNLMSYQKSEYTMWANATLREVKLFGSTDPLAVVEVKHIARDHHLQWTWCSVIYSDNNKPPFDVKPRMNQQSDDNNRDPSLPASPQVELNVPESMKIEAVRSTVSQDYIESTQDNEISSWPGDEDSISGLHTEMNKMDVVCSSQGSTFEGSIGDYMKSQRRWLAQDGSTLNAINEDDEEVASADPLLFLRSSQGSEDEVDEYHRRFVRRDEASRLRSPGLETNRPFELSCVNGWTQGEDSVSSDEIEESEATVPEGDDSVRPAASAVIIIDDNSSDSEGVQTVISTPFEKADNVSANTHTRSESEPSFAIIFSNLFNWSTLKVTDKVEIHEPCQKIAVPQLGSSSHESAVWIVERYKVLST